MRSRRPYLPGAFFHLMARTQGHVPWFEPPVVKDAIVRFISSAQAETDAEISAFTVMDNHIHLVIRQWRAPAARLMQSLLRRCALLVQRRYSVQGHVWERRFRDRLCTDANHLRNWIRYVHRNPVAAGLCRRVDEYAWSSHQEWLGRNATALHRPVIRPLHELFRSGSNQTDEEVLSAYVDFVTAESRLPLPILGMLPYRGGDVFFAGLGVTINSPSCGQVPVIKRPDLRDVIAMHMRRVAPGADLNVVRHGRGSAVSRLRGELITAAGRAGFRGVEIAHYLNISESQVSKVLRSKKKQLWVG